MSVEANKSDGWLDYLELGGVVDNYRINSSNGKIIATAEGFLKELSASSFRAEAEKTPSCVCSSSNASYNSKKAGETAFKACWNCTSKSHLVRNSLLCTSGADANSGARGRPAGNSNGAKFATSSSCAVVPSREVWLSLVIRVDCRS